MSLKLSPLPPWKRRFSGETEELGCLLPSTAVLRDRRSPVPFRSPLSSAFETSRGSAPRGHSNHLARPPERLAEGLSLSMVRESSWGPSNGF